ncbi:MAG: ABC transporter substrate-binding protein, partial [Actinomycetota bacterium]|nr:ABC transporter substrate-binding protein [Actinomycetota bacterium]
MAATTAGRRAVLVALLVGLTLTTGLTSCAAAPGSRMSADGPIKVGTLYAGSGQFADSSGPEYAGLQFWAARANAQGGLWVTALHRKKRVELVAYDDHSSAAQAGVLYRRLVEQDHVDILVSDFGSVLTAPAIQVAQRDKVLLFDQTGSGAQFFNGQNPYIVLCDVPTSAVWPIPLTSFLIQQKLRRVALVYGDNYFDASQD